MKNILFLAILLAIAFFQSCKTTSKQIQLPPAAFVTKPSDMPKNVILVIADGMGFSYLKALKIASGLKENIFDSFPCKTQMTTCSLDGADEKGKCIKGTKNVTDSAASATAMATGYKVKNDVVSLDIASNKPIQTILEVAKSMGKSTGIVATKLISDATPAAFAAHAKDRRDTKTILESMFKDVMPTLIFGADDELHAQYAKKSLANYTMVSKLSELKKILNTKKFSDDCERESCPYIYAGFSTHSLIPDILNEKGSLPLEITPKEYFEKNDIPHLSEMAELAVNTLSKNKNGFFVMIESSLTDIVGHYNRTIDSIKTSPSAIEVLISEMIELENTVRKLVEFTKNNPDTLLIVTADHETGGLTLDEDKTECLGKAGCIPSAYWTSQSYKANKLSNVNYKLSRHTNVNVPLFAIGSRANDFCLEEFANNSDIAKKILNSSK